MSVYEDINALVGYGRAAGLVDERDTIYTQNKLLEILGLDDWGTGASAKKGTENKNTKDFDPAAIPAVKIEELEGILSRLLDWAAANGRLAADSVVYRDLFDTKLMSALTPLPSAVTAKFEALRQKSPKEATDWFYRFSQDTDYIRRYRVVKDLKWKSATEYGELDITINLSKPEKDPKAIAAAKNAPQGGYPKCLLCKENEGYAGRVNSPARGNHRIIPLTLAGEDWGLQYSPYVYYNEHCIVFNYKHIPMKICHETFVHLLDFVTQFPHYTLGSNADLPIVGGSILSHDHFQGGHYEFPMARAQVETPLELKAHPLVKAGIIKWPMSVIRLDSDKPDALIEAADAILNKWRGYTDESSFIYAETEGVPHNTITPIARLRGGVYELDLVLRNNITTSWHPLGVYHPHAELHHIKKENIGLIEVMGLAVLPARLKTEMALLADALIAGNDAASDSRIASHAQWATTLPYNKGMKHAEVEEMLRNEIGKVFGKVLEHAGVFKRDNAGKAAFLRFVSSL